MDVAEASSVIVLAMGMIFMLGLVGVIMVELTIWFLEWWKAMGR